MRYAIHSRIGVVVVLLAGILAATSMGLGMAGCTVEEGASDNEEQVGRQERGRDPGHYSYETQWDPDAEEYSWIYELQYSDVILSPDGQFLLAMVPVPGPDKGFDEAGLALVVQELPTGLSQVFPEFMDLERVNFSPDGKEAYLLLSGGREIAVFDLELFEVVDIHQLTSQYSVLDVTPDGRYLVLNNLPTTDAGEDLYSAQDCFALHLWDMEEASACEVGFVELSSGDTWDVEAEMAIRDLDFSSKQGDILLTYSRWEGNSSLATVQFYNTEERQFVAKVDFPNCADELVVSHKQKLGILSPQSCAKDPISIIDLDAREFVSNLPGFGPVVLARDEGLAVGFTRKTAMENEWDYQDQTTDFGLIVVDLETYEWRVKDHGDNAPTYAVSPDGAYMYLYHDTLVEKEQPGGNTKVVHEPTDFMLVDVADFSTTMISESGIGLERFVWSAAGDTLFFLSGKSLYSVPSGATDLESIELPVTPELMNIRPQDDYILLGEDNAPTFYLVRTSGDQTPTPLTLSIAAQ